MGNPNVEAMSSEVKSWFAKTIVGMICADGHVDNTELEFLRTAIEFLESKDEINELMTSVKTKKIPQLTPIKMDSKQAFVILKYLANLTIVDGKITESEVKYFQLVGKVLGFPRDLLDKIWKTARKQMETTKPRATLDVGNTNMEVPLWETSGKKCTFRMNRALAPRSRVSLQLVSGEQGEDAKTYDPIIARVASVHQDKWDSHSFMVRADFHSAPNESNGFIQLAHPERYAQPFKTRLKTKNTALVGKEVQCYVCGHSNIPFYMIRPRSMITKPNIFGIPIYLKPAGNTDFCDYNLLQVTVCPNCFFASNSVDYFRSAADSSCPFDREQFRERWKEKTPVLKKTAQDQLEGLFSEERNAAQAILAYDFASQAHELLIEIGDKHEQLRKVASLRVTQAELLMNEGDRNAAEDNLRKVSQSLENIFEELGGEAIIRAALLIFLIKLYFKDAEMGKYMKFLDTYDDETKVPPGSQEHKVLQAALTSMRKAFEARNEYTHDKVESFHRQDDT